MLEDDRTVAAHLAGYLRRNGVGAARRVGLDIRGETVPDEVTLREAVGHVVVRIALGDA